MTLVAVAKCLQAIIWLVAYGNKYAAKAVYESRKKSFYKLYLLLAVIIHGAGADLKELLLLSLDTDTCIVSTSTSPSS